MPADSPWAPQFAPTPWLAQGDAGPAADAPPAPPPSAQPPAAEQPAPASDAPPTGGADDDAPPAPPGETGQLPAVDGQTGQPAPGVDPNAPPPSPFGGAMIWLMLGLLAVFWIFMMNAQRKEKKKQADLIANLSKGDKVQTVGGILGTIVDVRDQSIVVKVDENANTRMRFAKGAIKEVFRDDDDAGEEKS